MNDEITIYVHVLEEGTPTIRPTQAVSLGNGLYQVLTSNDYDPDDELWEFLPGSIVKIIPSKTIEGEDVLIAVKS